MKNIVTIVGKKKGPVSIIMAGNHGNEVCGIEAFKNVIPSLSIEKGTVIFILGNLKAIKRNVRFTEFNLNRAFLPATEYSIEIKKTYEYKRAQKIKEVFNQGDALLDIHSTLNPSEPFIICEENALEIVSYFPKEFKRIVHGFDDIEPGATDGYMLSKKQIGICVECGQHNDINALKIATTAIFSFLNQRGHISTHKSDFVVNREIIRMNFLYRTKTSSFKLSHQFFNFERITKNTLIGTDGCEEIMAPEDCVIVFAHNRDGKSEEAFLLGTIV